MLLIIFDEHVVPLRLPPAERKVKDQHISYLQTEKKLLATFCSTLRNSFIPCWPPPADPLKSQAIAEARGTLNILRARSHYLNSSWQTPSLDKALLILKIGLLLLPLIMWDSPVSPPAGQFSGLVYTRDLDYGLACSSPYLRLFSSQEELFCLDLT